MDCGVSSSGSEQRVSVQVVQRLRRIGSPSLSKPMTVPGRSSRRGSSAITSVLGTRTPLVEVIGLELPIAIGLQFSSKAKNLLARSRARRHLNRGPGNQLFQLLDRHNHIIKVRLNYRWIYCPLVNKRSALNDRHYSCDSNLIANG